MFDALVAASIAGAVVALGVWAVSAAIGRLPAGARCALWWLVSLKLLVGLAAIEPVAVPILPPATVTAPAVSAPVAADALRPSADDPVLARVSWRAALTAIWLAGLLAAAGLAVNQWRRIGSLRSRTQPADADLTGLVHALAERSGLTAAPDVRFSDETEAPMVTGLVRPVVILPARLWPSLTALQQEMAICHELMHLRRGDLWLGLVPSLAERLFFFHPLAHLAAREYMRRTRGGVRRRGVAHAERRAVRLRPAPGDAGRRATARRRVGVRRGTFFFESQTEDWHARSWFADARPLVSLAGCWPPLRW